MSAIHISSDLSFLNPPESHSDWQTRISLITRNKSEELFCIPFLELKIFRNSYDFFCIEILTNKNYNFMQVVIDKSTPKLQIRWDSEHCLIFDMFSHISSEVRLTPHRKIEAEILFICEDVETEHEGVEYNQSHSRIQIGDEGNDERGVIQK